VVDLRVLWNYEAGVMMDDGQPHRWANEGEIFDSSGLHHILDYDGVLCVHGMAYQDTQIYCIANSKDSNFLISFIISSSWSLFQVVG
jgi:hypothetical protein